MANVTLSAADRAALEAMYPSLLRYAKISASKLRLRGEARDEFTAAVIANCTEAYARLAARAAQIVAYPSVLVSYAVRQIRGGRSTGNKINSRDLQSPVSLRKMGRVDLQRLDRWDEGDGEWKEITVEDRKHPSPFAIAQCRHDWPIFLKTLNRTQRRAVALILRGERNKAIAQRMELTESRISQLKEEVRLEWNQWERAQLAE